MVINLPTIISYCRQMRGEELQRLSVQQLQELEKTLESGLGSVLKTKVSDTHAVTDLQHASYCTVMQTVIILFHVKIVEPKNPRRDQWSGKKGKHKSPFKLLQLNFISK